MSAAPAHRAAEKLHGIAPFRMFCAGVCRRRAARGPAVYPRGCLFFRAPSYTLQSWHIFVQGALRAISWMLSSTSEKRGSSFADFALFSARGARARLFSPRPFLPRARLPVSPFGAAGAGACGALFFFCGACLAAAGTCPPLLWRRPPRRRRRFCTPAGAAPSCCGRCACGLFRLKFLTFFPAGGGRTGFFPRRGPAAALSSRPWPLGSAARGGRLPSSLFQTPASATRVPRTGCGCASLFNIRQISFFLKEPPEAYGHAHVPRAPVPDPASAYVSGILGRDHS